MTIQPFSALAHRAADRNEKFKYVALGDSLTAGMQDATLIARGQDRSYVNQFAQQTGLDFKQPLIDDNGIPPGLFLDGDASIIRALVRYAQVGLAAAGPLASLALGVVPPELALLPLYHAGGMGQREEHGTVQNLAIPGFELRHLSDVANVTDLMQEMADKAETPGALVGLGPYVREILQDGKSGEHGLSEVDRAIAQQPDLITLWAGNNDALESALVSGVDDRTLTPIEDRRWVYQTYNPLTGRRTPHETDEVQKGFRNSLIGDEGVLTRLLEETDAHIVMMNIPDVTVIPFLREVGQKVGPLPFRIVLPGGADVTERIENWTIPSSIRGDGHDGRTTFPEGSRVGIGMLLTKFLHFMTDESVEDFEQALTMMDSGGVFTEDEILDPGEIETVRGRTRQFNELIAQAAENPRIHLVDVNSVLNRSKTEGIPLRGEGPEITVSNTFTGLKDAQGREGFFSYDGVHPSDVGHAVIANLVLDTVKRDLSHLPRFERFADVAPVDEKAVFAADPHLDQRPKMILTHVGSDPLFRINDGLATSTPTGPEASTTPSRQP